MTKYNPREKNRQGNCSVCEKTVMVDEIGNGGVCPNCGWEQDAAANEIPNMPSPILISLNKAKRLYKEGKKLKPDFADFIDAYEMYGEVQFYYKSKRYGVFAPRDVIVLFECDASEPQIMEFATIEEFIANAKIDDILIKDLWDEVKDPYWLQ